ncbi:MAG: hypothetical protein LBI18_07215, partial [Planctomycetaceae bacterium]|nr:hypothetical protein [Planctomycetaceae bacterium]
MNKFARMMIVFCFVLSLVFAPVAALAQENTAQGDTTPNRTETVSSFSLTKTSLGYLGVGIGAGLAVIGGS